MSRVDEAMRRAAGEARESAPAMHIEAAPVAVQDTASLAGEPYPDETPERRRQLADAPTIAPRVAPVVPANATEAQASPSVDASIKRVDPILAEKLVGDPRTPASSREQYRRLAAVLHDSQAVTGLRVVMIASAVAGEGKTLTAVNLALTLSGSYRKRVLLIDADLRRPTVHKVFRLDAAYGLADGLEATGEPKLVARPVSSTLSILAAGRPLTDPMASLISERMRRLVSEAKETFEWVIIDTPPLVLLPDANLLASMVDGVVLVIKAASTSYDLTKRAVEAVGRPRIIGVVLNRATTGAVGDYDGYYDYYYSHPRSAGS
jgi:protein-tyrosine kinase